MSTRAGRVVVVGSLNLDHTVVVERLPKPGETVAGSAYGTAAGGKGLNQAVAAARQGADVSMVGVVGSDPAGSLLVGVLAEERVGVDRVRRVLGPSGTALVTVDTHGGNTIVVAAGANSEMSVADLTPEVFAGAAVVVCQLEVAREVVSAALSAARAAGAIALLDPAPVDGTLPPDLVGLADLVVPNETEAVMLVPAAAGRGPLDAASTAGRGLLRAGARVALVTLGARGALLVERDQVTPVPPFQVESVDPTAAGDAFVGALAASLATGEPIAAATRRAAAAGALATTRLGAVPSLPDREAVDALVDAADPRARVEHPGAAGARRAPTTPATPPRGSRRPSPSGGPGAGPSGPIRPGGPRT